MRETSNVPAPAGSAISGEAAHRDLERAALRDLVLLSTQCADEEVQIEDRRESARKAELEASEEACKQIEQRRDRQEADVRRQYDERLALVAQKFQSDMAKLTRSTEAARGRIGHERDAVDRDLKEQRGQAMWLTDSLLEAAQIKLREGTRKAAEDHAGHVKDLDDLEGQAVALLRKYGRRAAELSGVSRPGAEGCGADAGVPSFAAGLDVAKRHLISLGSLWLPETLAGVWPYLAGILLCLMVGGIAQLIAGLDRPHWLAAGMSMAVTLAGVIVAMRALASICKEQIRGAYAPLRQALSGARLASTNELTDAKAALHMEYLQAETKCRDEKQRTNDRLGAALAQAIERHDSHRQALQADSSGQSAAIAAGRDRRRQQAQERLKQFVESIRQQREADLRAAHEAHERQAAEIGTAYARERADLENRWAAGLARIQTPIEQSSGEISGQLSCDWSDPRWNRWTPPREFPYGIRFGELRVDLKLITDKVPRSLGLPESFSVPALLPFPRQSSLLIHTDLDGRAQGIRTLQLVMLRLLTSVPAGRVHFTIIDPVGLGQNFAGFMHLADHDEALVGSRIWTQREHIERQLADLTEHMETVIQKYLRNEFHTIDDYNAQAAELAEPYRFLVVADFPAGFDADGFRRLASIASTGARCGVYMLLLRDVRQALSAEAHLEELEAHSVNLVQQGGAKEFAWNDEVFCRFPLTLDSPPDEKFLTRILDVVGRAAKDSKRVEVPFTTIAPPAGRFWSGLSRDEVQVPIGRMGATRFQMLRLGRDLAQHTLIAGKTGSGKSNLLHTIITNAALWYGPDELELYLVDFKKGVEFKSYVTRSLPHARAIAVESDREFGFSVLQRVDAELTRRGAMFRELGVQDLSGYREASGKKLPRTLLIVDEFQEFFSEDDRLSQDAALLLDRLVRQGRAFGVHVILGSQTIGGTSGLSRSTIGQMAVRIALQCSEADSQLILGDSNSAARLLSRPGEAIYNDAGGLVEGNSPFQVAYLPDKVEDAYLSQLQALARERGAAPESPIVFEGNAPAAIVKNHELMRLLAGTSWLRSVPAPMSWLGEPVAIKAPTAVIFRRQSGSNVLVIGQQEDSGLAVISSSMISLAAQLPPESARFVVFDGTQADSPLQGTLGRVVAAMPHQAVLVEWRAASDAIHSLAAEMQNRLASDRPAKQSIFVIIYGLQRYRVLRRQEEEFSFGKGEEPAKPRPDKQFSDLLREGPALGIHVLAWADTPISIERTLDRNSMREFDNRVLFQMSASDSSNLIDSPLANKLGVHRALFYSEEQGIIEKLRPYALPSPEWLDYVRQRLLARASM
jgi:hypothetical protein